MQLEIIFFLIFFIIRYNRYMFVIGNPMFGPNVRNAHQGEFPFIVGLRRRVNESGFEDHICTGSLITRQDVLTAAHCFEDEVMHEVTVIVGSHHLRRGTPYEIYWWFTFNNWARIMHLMTQFRVNDIANIRLTCTVPANIDLGVLSPLPPSDYYNKVVLTAAWGRNENHTVPNRMRTVELTVLDLNDCEDRVQVLNNGSRVIINDRHICTVGNPYAIMYFGDSGGPILYQGMIIAINKSTIPFPNEPTNRRKINVATTVNWYRIFIDYVINSNFDCYDYDLSVFVDEE